MELAMQQEKAKQLRADIIKMLYLCQSGHPGRITVSGGDAHGYLL